MFKFKNLLITVSLITTLTACTQVKTQEYYAENLDEAKKVLQKCEEMANQGKSLEGKKLENCTNAGNAVMQGMMKDLTKGLMDAVR
ncbi:MULTISPECIES: EexN family lipoprotein [Acinetobacter]|jgi:hypothetical protein|uniref:EexN family lipoprotein n=1 Tax=Acinetobacter towneri TaxID=202956 RepID=A0AAP4M2F8_9GAMM|nr:MULTISPECIES: EexN family lipoprotein [Acinetobacter]AVH48293.1 hypothetical protein C3Y93_00900 [Acinetobacter sp. SWBY1]ENV70410.1 hypothetical protein F947_00411 [Acinetobacter towneri DSM 14962 = CIP 107472]MBT0886366.1 EexN family lipoprotein [Acinetobacter towneri]MCA4779054.1 EexN family lipoprotein [Acinetobacter towneri]MCA4784424.1 EexN family lipoprotein [Acinetobacter towneri]